MDFASLINFCLILIISEKNEIFVGKLGKKKMAIFAHVDAKKRKKM